MCLGIGEWDSQINLQSVEESQVLYSWSVYVFICTSAESSAVFFAGTNQRRDWLPITGKVMFWGVIEYQRCPCETDRWETSCVSISELHQTWCLTWKVNVKVCITDWHFCSRLRENTGWKVGCRASRKAMADCCRELCMPQPAAEPSLWTLGAVPSGKGLLSWDPLRTRVLVFPKVLALIAF